MNWNTKQHWEKVFATKQETELSWVQPYPKTSIDFLEQFQLPLDANIIDIGGGDSHLVDTLLDNGYQNIWVLDISANALGRAKQRLGEWANQIHWRVSDVTEFVPPVQFNFGTTGQHFIFLQMMKQLINTYLSPKRELKKME